MNLYVISGSRLHFYALTFLIDLLSIVNQDILKVGYFPRRSSQSRNIYETLDREKTSNSLKQSCSSFQFENILFKNNCKPINNNHFLTFPGFVFNYSIPFLESKSIFNIVNKSMHLKKTTSKKDKLSVSPIKSTSPLKSSSSKNKLNNSAMSKKINIQDGFTNNLTKSREMLSKTLDTYTLLIRSKNPIRCLEHNSNISIYCETEQKLLCANCIFGRVEHKFHRVTPIDHSYDKIEKDVDTMNRLIDREVGAMKHTGQILMQNLVQEQNDAHDCLTDLVKQYEECHQCLQQCFLTSKNKIINRLESVRRNYQTLLLQLKLNLQNYDLSNIVKPINRDYFKKEQFLLFEHVVCSAIAGQKKFEESQWLKKKREVLKVSGEQRKKILVIIELINRMNADQK